MCEEEVSLEIFPHNKSFLRMTLIEEQRAYFDEVHRITVNRQHGQPLGLCVKVCCNYCCYSFHFFVNNRIKFVAWNCFRKRKSIRSTSTRVRICEIRLTVWSGSPWIYKSDLIVPYCQEKGWLLYWLLPQIKSN